MMTHLKNSLLISLCTCLLCGSLFSEAMALDNLSAGLGLDGGANETLLFAGSNLPTKLLQVCCPSGDGAGSIGYNLKFPQKITMCVFDQQGSEVVELVDRAETSGAHHISWDGRKNNGQTVPAGTYFLMMKTEESVFLKRMVLE